MKPLCMICRTCPTQMIINWEYYDFDIPYHGTALQHFETETQDLAGVEWSPNGCVLAAWDSCLEVSVHLTRFMWYAHWSRMKHLRIHVKIPQSFSKSFFKIIISVHVYTSSTKCCCIPWMGVCCQPTVLMNGHWALNQSSGVPVASFWSLAAMMRRYNLYKHTTCF